MAKPLFTSFKRFLVDVKEYWFLIALILSGASIVLYMFVYDVTPWDAHIETRNRRQQTQHHVNIGFELLERGQYQRAKGEFERALLLIATNDSAISGRYLSELFIDMQSTDWNPSVGLSLEARLEQRFRDNIVLKDRQHIVDKYLGDLNAGVVKVSKAREHYEKALKLQPNYLDALDSYYLLIYGDRHDLDLKNEEILAKLVELGERMVKIDPNDYRGLHKLGYALYEQAIAAPDEDRRSELLEKAAEQSRKASLLKGNDFAVVSDLGEIVRATDATLAVTYHKWAQGLVELQMNGQPHATPFHWMKQLHTTDVPVVLSTPKQMKALVNFELALDYLAKHRQDSEQVDLRLYRRFLAAGKAIDTERDVVPVYEDGLRVLDIFVPARP